MTIAFAATQKGYANLWGRMHILAQRQAVAKALATKLHGFQSRYEQVARKIGCPWYFVAIIHQMEAAANFGAHLHNGDSLKARTVHVPAGRPIAGSPPFTWEESAIDALTMKGFDKITDWSIPRMLYSWEAYNGFGYIAKKINSPYIWSFSDLYSAGKYVADGIYDASAVSAQCGAAVILRAMIDLGYVAETPKGNADMSALDDLLKQFAYVAPVIAQNVGGPLGGIVVKAVADAFSAHDADPATVVDAIHGAPVSDIVTKLAAAEQVIQQLFPPAAPVRAAIPVIEVGASAPQPAPAAPVTPVTVTVAPIPAPQGAFGALDGYVTYLGIAIVGGGFVASFMHVVPPDLGNAIISIGTAIGGAGLVNKWEKWRAAVPILPALPVISR